MPIRIHCPNGCLLRMPVDRAGKIVRCPGCKATISIPSVSESEKRSGKSIPYLACLIGPTPTNEGNEASVTRKDNPEPCHQPPSDQFSAPSIEFTERVIFNTLNSDSLPVVLDTNQFVEEPDSSLLPNLGEKTDSLFESDEESSFLMAKHPSEINDLDANQKINRNVTTGFRLPNSTVTGSRTESWRQRLFDANADRMVLAKLIALFIFGLGLINVLPAIAIWFNSDSGLESRVVPRWLYFQVFVAAIHIVYTILLLQVPDWSTLRAVSIVMLICGFVFGLISSALLIEGGQGMVTNFLALPQIAVHQATIWCIAMLFLAVLMAYTSGREAADWRRAEQLLVEILCKHA